MRIILHMDGSQHVMFWRVSAFAYRGVGRTYQRGITCDAGGHNGPPALQIAPSRNDVEDAMKQEVAVQSEAHYVLAQRGELLTSFGTQCSRNSH